VVIVGASLAGVRAAAALRDEGFAGEITMVGAERHQPYDRPPLSKQFLAGKWGEERLALVSPDALAKLSIDLRLGHSASSLDAVGHLIELDDGARLGFDKALIATGSHPRQLPGLSESESVMTLRTIDDSRRLAAAITEGTCLAVVGGGFIGSEVAATARGMGADVTVIEALEVPLGRVLGRRVGEACAALHRANGVGVLTGTGVAGVETAPGGSGSLVTLADGSALEADVVVIGIGITPTTGWLEGSGLLVEDGVVVDETLHATDDVLAAGDVARWIDLRNGVTVRAEHWTNAAEQGAAAARSLLAGRAGADRYDPVPYVWSDQYDTKIQVLGSPGPEDDVVIVDGSEHEGRFVAVYGREGSLTAVVGFGRPRQLMGFRPLLEDGATFEAALGLLSS
jgi:3-phenylpropionate/trans-cinnamate dioxygenase ferredoxin reductase component